jgi:molybdenum cofactor cytidylyltransferase
MVNNTAPKIGIILLAAGVSSRLGSPKQLLDIQGKYLLQHVIDIIVNVQDSELLLVLGASGRAIEAKLETQNIPIVHNSEWSDGLASSIRMGVTTMLDIHPHTEAIILVLCDQPYVSVEIISELINAHTATQKLIVQCRYGEAVGPPTLFDKQMFPHLLALRGSEGAKTVVHQFADQVVNIDFPLGSLDIDTISDYKHLLQTFAAV